MQLEHKSWLYSNASCNERSLLLLRGKIQNVLFSAVKMLERELDGQMDVRRSCVYAALLHI